MKKVILERRDFERLKAWRNTEIGSTKYVMIVAKWREVGDGVARV